MIRALLILVLLTIPLPSIAALHNTEEWVALYLSPCPKTPDNRVCHEKTKRNFKRMLKYKKLLFKYLDKYNLPRWLATIPFIESEYTENAISKAGAIGLWQIMPSNLQYYLTTSWSGINYNYTRKPKRAHAIRIGKDAEKNTEIACKMLKHLYEKYGKDHETVVRAYNAGETRIDKARKGIGKPLKDETLNYYFQLMALQNLLSGYNDYFVD